MTPAPNDGIAPPDGGPLAPARPSRAGALALTAAVLVAASAVSFVAVRGAPPPATLQDRARAVAATLRCPQCEDLSVADSPSAVAGEIRADIARRLRAGQTPDRIRAFYVERYGPRILLSPPASGSTLFVWLLPALFLGVGIVAAAAAISRWTRASSDRVAAPTGTPDDRRRAPALAEPDRRLLDAAIAAHGGRGRPGAPFDFDQGTE